MVMVPRFAESQGNSLVQRSFAGGEISPALHARADQVKYETGLATCRNFYVQKEGGVVNRAGTELVIEVKDSSVAVRLVEFIFSDSNTYVLEFGNLYMRVIRNGAQINVSGVSAWSGATTYIAGDLVVSGGTNYYCFLGHTNNLPPNATYWNPLTGTVFEIPTPYITADLADLQYVQSADVVTICHPNYPPRELARTAHTGWVLSTITFAPIIAAPGSPSVAGAGTGFDHSYVVASVDSDTLEESLASASATLTNKQIPTSAAPNVFTWAAVTNAKEYHVYRQDTIVTGTSATGMRHGYTGTVEGLLFNDDDSVVPDFTVNPVTSRNPFSATDDYPATAAYYQGRRGFAGTNNNPEKIFLSRSGRFTNFTESSPSQDDDSVTFPVIGREVNQVRHLMELTKLLVFTTGAEWAILGNASGVVVPGEINQKVQTREGSSQLRALTVGGNALFVQNQLNQVRDIVPGGSDEQAKGDDLSIFASHLFKGKTIVDWAYQQIPTSIVWAVRSDGTLLGMTYIREHALFGWTRHDTAGGKFENVAVVPEANEDILYCVVKRTIDGATKRYIERMKSRNFTDLDVDAFFVDSGLTYDGRTQTGNVTISGGTAWDPFELLTATLSGSGLSLDSTFLGDEFTYDFTPPAYVAATAYIVGDMVIEGGVNYYCTAATTGTAPPNSLYWQVIADGAHRFKFTITAVASTTVCTVTASKTLPAALRSTALTGYGMARLDLGGLSHLEGETLTILSDGATHAEKTVSSSVISLDAPGLVVHVGIGITADAETLDIEDPSRTTLADKKKKINELTIFLEETSGLKVGRDSDNLTALKQDDAGVYGRPDLFTGKVTTPIFPEWNSNGRIFIRQTDPLPATILAVVPTGQVG
jgi:hypothetical protein